MRALVLKKNKVLKYTNVPLPKKKYKNSVLIKVAASGICGSDIHRGFEGGAYHYPLIMGHEFAGVVEESFSGSKFNKGNRVVVFPLIPCKKCNPCQTGDYAQCTSYDYLGSRSNGGFAEYVYVPEENLFLLPEHVNIIHAAMTEPCAVALHGVKKLSITPGDTGAVYGGGPIGNIVAQWMRIRGANKVIVVDIDKLKLEIAKNMDFITVNSKDKDPINFILSETKNNGADCVVEACGFPLTFLQSIQSAGRSGEVVFMGNISGEFRVGEKNFSNILRKELKIYGTWNSKVVPREKDDWSGVLKFMDRELNVEPLISHIPNLSEGVEIFDRMVGKKDYYCKVIFKI